jgi:hypothetical protein
MSDRKYRHKGYNDSGTDSSRGSGSGPRPPFEPRPERMEGAPRGRTAGGFGPEVFKCGRCGDARRSLGEIEIATDAQCDCGADLHTCWNCSNFDTSTRWECKVQIPARISPKDARNACEFFEPKMMRDLTADKGKIASADDARKAFDALFKK